VSLKRTNLPLLHLQPAINAMLTIANSRNHRERETTLPLPPTPLCSVTCPTYIHAHMRTRSYEVVELEPERKVVYSVASELHTAVEQISFMPDPHGPEHTVVRYMAQLQLTQWRAALTPVMSGEWVVVGGCVGVCVTGLFARCCRKVADDTCSCRIGRVGGGIVCVCW
jgi:hypothetical protein